VNAELRVLITEMFKLHPSMFAGMRISSEYIFKIGEINYQIVRHALERELRSRSLLRQLGAS
jgi:hypothetical protein